jgi:hypothetical protein
MRRITFSGAGTLKGLKRGLFAATILAAGAVTVLPASASIGPISKRINYSFGTCSASTTTLQATMNQKLFTQNENVVVRASILHVGPNSCTFQGLYATSYTQELGPCGVASFVILNPRGREVYPGNVHPSCSSNTTLTLNPSNPLNAAESWNEKYGPPNTGKVPAGQYVVVVAGKIDFPITIH